jgi:hypothetical protein
MQHHEKTKAQLIEKLQALRQELAEVEKEEENSNPASQTDTTESSTRPQRIELQSGIKFIPDFGLVNAQGVDVSDSGICFESTGEIPFEMEYEHEGESHQYRAKMVWMKQLDNGNSRFGFEFLQGEPASGLLWIYKGLED